MQVTIQAFHLALRAHRQPYRTGITDQEFRRYPVCYPGGGKREASSRARNHLRWPYCLQADERVFAETPA